MITTKRQRFLKTYLAALGAKKISWSAQDENSIYGIVLYDLNDKNERQEFVWHITEYQLPNDKVKDLLSYLTRECLLDGDKLKVPIADIDIPNMDPKTKNELFEELFSVKVNLIDDGKETDFYFIHN